MSTATSSEQRPIKLVLTDIDGTILPDGETVVSDKVLAAFHTALASGLRVGPATGRNIQGVASVFAGDQSCIRTGLATNGMQVHLDGELIYEEHISHEAIEHLASEIKGIPDAGILCFDGKTPLLLAGEVECLRQSFAKYAEIAVPIEEVPSFPVVKVNAFTPATWDATRAAVDFLREHVPEIDYNIPKPGFINMLPRGWNKGCAVDVLCQALGIGIDQVVVFGDSNNDLEMLEHVPNSACVSNATPEAKAAARWHIGSDREGAVADAICALAAGEFPFTE